MRRLSAVVGISGILLTVGAGPAAAQSFEPGNANGLLVLLAAIGAGAAIFLLIWILFGPNAAVERNLRGRLGRYVETSDDGGILASVPILRRFARQAETMAEERGLLSMIENALAQANIPLRAGEAITGAIIVGLVLAVVVGAVTQNPVAAVGAAVFAMMLAAFAVQTIASRERKRFEAQLPDTLNLISTSLRAGYSLMQAIEAVASESAEPTRREFGRAMSEIRLGHPTNDALKEIADRMQSVDFEWAVLAISIQREVGGNLAEVLQTAAETMLARNRLRREMKALTAEGRISAIVLGALPFFLFTFLFISNRSYLEPLFSTIYGIGAIVGALVLIVIGIFWLTRIVRVEV